MSILLEIKVMSEAFRRLCQQTHLSAKTEQETAIAEQVCVLIANQQLLELPKLEQTFGVVGKRSPVIKVQQHALADYDEFLVNKELNHDA